MSAGAGTREVAWRLFAAEYDDASFSYSESDEERAPNYVVTPTGARVNRLFVVGVLTEIEEVGDGVLRARVVDPTGAFVVYAGQYQPDAMAFLERATPPAFVAVTGKARTFQPEDSDVVYTSIRPESINEVDADTRDRWVVQTAEQTVDRVGTAAAALDRPERGDDLQAVLAEAGVDDGLAAGIPAAIAEYGTTTGYLAAVRDLALDAVRVVADEREEAGELSLAPDEGGDVDLEFDVDALADVAAATDASSTASTDADSDTSATTADESAVEADSEPETESETEADPEPESEADSEPEESAAATAAPGGGSQSDATSTDSEPASTEQEPETGSASTEQEPETGSDSTEPEPEPDTANPEPEEPAASADDADAGGGADPATDEMYEFDEEERAEIEENYDMGFSSGNDIPEQGEADIDVPDPEPAADADEQADAGDSAPASEPGPDSESESESAPESEPGAASEPEPESETEPEPDEGPEPDAETEPSGDEADEADEDAEDDVETAQAADVDLEDAVMETMQDLDDGSGADRADLVDTVAAEYGVTADDVEAAIQDALMSGRCYEPDDDTIVSI
ncbi:RPA family protein [Halobacteriaceae archaeon GCM10025711]